MPQQLSEIRALISQKREQEATHILLALLKQGDPKVYHQAKKLSDSTGKTNGKKDEPKKKKITVSNFLDNLEKKEKNLLSFLSFYQRALTMYGRQKWPEAKELFTESLSLHKESYQVTRENIQSHIQWCKNGMQMKNHLLAGASKYKEGKWEQAIAAYQLAEKLYQDGFPFPKEKITQSIAACENGKKYEHLVGKARHWMTLENWYQANLSFQEARSIYRKGYKPELAMIDYEIGLCKEALKADEKSSGTGIISEFRNNPILILLGLGILLISTILGAYIMDFNKVSKPASFYEKKMSDSLDNQLIVEENLVVDKEEEEESVMEEIDGKTMDEKPIPIQSAIAVLPFCESDPLLKVICENIYKDVNQNIGQLVDDELKYIDQTKVKSSIRKLRLRPEQACERKNMLKIAQGIYATQLLTGVFQKEENGEYKLVYSLYNLSNGSTKTLVNLSGKDVQVLRVELKHALQKSF